MLGKLAVERVRMLISFDKINSSEDLLALLNAFFFFGNGLITDETVLQTDNQIRKVSISQTATSLTPCLGRRRRGERKRGIY